MQAGNASGNFKLSGMEEQLPPFLPFGVDFRVPTTADMLAVVHQHAEFVRSSTMHRVNSAFELADMAKMQSLATMETLQRTRSFSMLKERHTVFCAKVDEHVERSWALARAARGCVVAAFAVFTFPLSCARAVAVALWEIFSRPDEAKYIAECAARDARRGDAKED